MKAQQESAAPKVNMNIQKATHEQLKRHNRQLVLRAVYGGLANSRAALAQATGLAKPTVSSLIGDLLEEGLLTERGRGPSTGSGGKRPRLLEFMPAARQVIGISINQARASGVLSNLAGEISARHSLHLSAGENDPANIADIGIVQDVVNGLIAQLDAPLLCIGVGVPGTVDTSSGIVRQSRQLGWSNLPLATQLTARYEIPVYVGNSTELCALAQFAFGTNGESAPRNLVTVLVDHGVEVGVTLEGGSYHSGGDISNLHLLAAGSRPNHQRLDSLFNWEAIRSRVQELREVYPGSSLPDCDLSFMHIRYCATKGDSAALELCDELSARLAMVISWVIGLLQPETISLAGPIADLGEAFLERVAEETAQLLAPVALSASFSLAYSPNLGALGAVALVLQKELAIL